jgi:UDP-N-acetyl-D-galactosamine dehydrogenase
MHRESDIKLAVVGLGYVGLPLAVEFGKLFDTLGFDIDPVRVDDLRQGRDHTLEVGESELSAATRLRFSVDAADLAECKVFVVTVPTPIDSARRPDLKSLVTASEIIGKVLKVGDIVIFESTVYPGCTEEICVPVLEAESKLKYNKDFFCGYSPERINPGDKSHRLTDIKKITSGSTPEVAEFVDQLYVGIIRAGTCKVSSMKVAEAAKVIENTQRDLNIALVNELAILFNKLEIDTVEVLEAAATKWNFLPFRPGLVGGHCIGVDPYYLTQKAQEVGHHSQVILAGRRTNDGMGAYVADQVIRLMVRKGINPVGARVLLLGLAFKENCPDLRNTRVIDVVKSMEEYNVQADVHDPWVDALAAQREYGVELVAEPASGSYDAIIVAVGHAQFLALGPEGVRAFGKPNAVCYDVKSIFPRQSMDARL